MAVELFGDFSILKLTLTICSSFSSLLQKFFHAAFVRACIAADRLKLRIRTCGFAVREVEMISHFIVPEGAKANSIKNYHLFTTRVPKSKEDLFLLIL